MIISYYNIHPEATRNDRAWRGLSLSGVHAQGQAEPGTETARDESGEWGGARLSPLLWGRPGTCRVDGMREHPGAPVSVDRGWHQGSVFFSRAFFSLSPRVPMRF